VKHQESGRERPLSDTVHDGTPQVTAPADAKAQDKHRVTQRPVPAGGQGPRPIPQRAGRAEVPVPAHRFLDPTGTGKTRCAMRWKPALNAFAITFGDRFPGAETY
jgi:hypothetical protein